MLIKNKSKNIVTFICKAIINTFLSLLPVTTMAIVNMDGLHFDNQEDTFSADVDLSVSGSTGNSTSSKAALNTQLNWIDENSINLAILGYQYGENNNVRNVNKSFIHYRYIHKLNNSIDWELFTQLETNEFTRLSYRGLLGSGIRYSITNSETHRAFLGAGAFHSKEEIEFTQGLTDDGIEEITRANLYFLSKYKITSTMSFSNVIYYQPRLNRLSDYRALLESKLDIKIHKDLTFRLSLDVEHDSEPSQTIKSTDVSYMTGLVIKF